MYNYSGTDAWLTSAAVISACALLFTVASFWWLNARRGRLESFEPHTYAAAVNPEQVRIRSHWFFIILERYRLLSRTFVSAFRGSRVQHNR